MRHYPAKFTREPEGGYTVTFRDIPEAITYGETLEQARDMAADALLTAMDFYIEDQRTVPPPSKLRKGENEVALPFSAAVKIDLLNAQLTQQVRPADLAKRLGIRPQEVTRLTDLHHTTKIDTLVSALDVLGYQISYQVQARV